VTDTERLHYLTSWADYRRLARENFAAAQRVALQMGECLRCGKPQTGGSWRKTALCASCFAHVPGVRPLKPSRLARLRAALTSKGTI
jgi:hypothetical protein